MSAPHIQFEETIICLGIGQCSHLSNSDTARYIESDLIPKGYARRVSAERRPNGRIQYELTDKGINAYKILETANGRPFRR